MVWTGNPLLGVSTLASGICHNNSFR